MASNGEIYGSQSAESYPCPFGASRWAFGVQRSAFSVQRSAFKVQRSTFNVQRSTFGGRHFGIEVAKRDASPTDLNVER